MHASFEMISPFFLSVNSLLNTAVSYLSTNFPKKSEQKLKTRSVLKSGAVNSTLLFFSWTLYSGVRIRTLGSVCLFYYDLYDVIQLWHTSKVTPSSHCHFLYLFLHLNDDVCDFVNYYAELKTAGDEFRGHFELILKSVQQ